MQDVILLTRKTEDQENVAKDGLRLSDPGFMHAPTVGRALVLLVTVPQSRNPRGRAAVFVFTPPRSVSLNIRYLEHFLGSTETPACKTLAGECHPENFA